MAKPIKISILGDISDLEKKLGQADKDLEGFGSKAAKVGKTVAKWGAAVATAGVAVGAALYKVGSDFDDAYDTIRVGTGATGKALGGLQADFKAVVQDVPTDFASASTAIADLNTRTGASGKTLQGLAEQVLEMTRLTGGDLSTNISAVTRVFGDWSIKTQDQGRTLDYLFKVSQTTGIGVDTLADKVVQFGAPLRQFGFSFDQAAALMGKWEKEGVNLETIMGGLRAGLGKLAKSGKDPAKAFQEITQRIKDAGSTGEATKIAIETFGVRAGPDLASAVREGRFDLDALVASIGNSKETILGAASDTADFAESWQKFKNRVLVVLEPIATRVFGAVGKAMDTLSNWWDDHGDEVVAGLERVAGFLKGVGEAAKTAAQWVAAHWGIISKVILGVLAVLSPLLLILGAQIVAVGILATASAARQVAAWVVTQAQAVKSAALMLIQCYKVVGGFALMAVQAVANGVKIAAVWTAQIVASAIRGAVAFAVQVARVVAGWVLMGVQSLIQAARMAAAWVIAMGPVGWVIAAVVGLVAIIVANWDRVVSWTKTAWSAVTGALSAAWEWIKGAAKAALDWLVNLFLNFTGPGLIIKHWDAIVNATKAAWHAVTSAVSAAWTWLTNAISTGVSTAVTFVTGLPGRILGALRNFGSLLYNKGVDLIHGLVNGIASAASFVGNVAKNIVNAMLRWINGHIIDGINGMLDFTIMGIHINPPDIPHIPLLADGAIVKSPTLAVIGEAGPEAVIPLSSGKAGRRASLMDQAGLSGDQGVAHAGDTYNVNVTVQGGTRATGADIGRATVWALKTSGR